MASLDMGLLNRYGYLTSEKVTYLAEESDYYNRRFDEWEVDSDDIRTLDDLSLIPFTTKDDERRYQSETTSTRPLGDHQAVDTADLNLTLSSSGTTGKPTYFGLTEQDRDGWETLVARAAKTMGVRADDTVVHAIDRPIVPGGLQP